MLTGYIPSPKFASLKAAAFGFEFAARENPDRCSDRGSGYIIPGTKSAAQTLFFSDRRKEDCESGGFDPKLLDHCCGIMQPITIGEWMSLFSIDLSGTKDCQGPLLFVLGEFDYGPCNGDCKGAYDVDEVGKMFPNVQCLDVQMRPWTEHCLTLHQGARDGFKETFGVVEG